MNDFECHNVEFPQVDMMKSSPVQVPIKKRQIQISVHTSEECMRQNSDMLLTGKIIIEILKHIQSKGHEHARKMNREK